MTTYSSTVEIQRGVVLYGTAAEALTAGDAVFISDDNIFAQSNATSDKCVGVVLASVDSGKAVAVLSIGSVIRVATTLTVGAKVSGAAAGAIADWTGANTNILGICVKGDTSDSWVLIAPTFQMAS